MGTHGLWGHNGCWDIKVLGGPRLQGHQNFGNTTALAKVGLWGCQGFGDTQALGTLRLWGHLGCGDNEPSGPPEFWGHPRLGDTHLAPRLAIRALPSSICSLRHSSSSRRWLCSCCSPRCSPSSSPTFSSSTCSLSWPSATSFCSASICRPCCCGHGNGCQHGVPMGATPTPCSPGYLLQRADGVELTLCH